MKTVYFILGSHRSGTSALSGVLYQMGMNLGIDLLPPTAENPKGYFENTAVYSLNKKILAQTNSVWHDYSFDLDNITEENFELYCHYAKNIIKEQFNFSEKMVIKDPRICILFPIWEKAFLDLGMDIKVIIPYRNPLEVASSLKARDKFTYEKSILLWTQHLLSAEKYTKKYERIYLFFDDLIENPESYLKKIEDLTNNKITKKISKKIDSFVEKKLKHNNFSLHNFDYEEAPEFFIKSIDMIKNNKLDDQSIFNDIRKDFNVSMKVFHNAEIQQVINGFKVKNKEFALLKEKYDNQGEISEVQKNEVTDLKAELANQVLEFNKLNADLENIKKSKQDTQQDNSILLLKNSELKSKLKALDKDSSRQAAENKTLEVLIGTQKNEIQKIEERHSKLNKEFSQSQIDLSIQRKENEKLKDYEAIKLKLKEQELIIKKYVKEIEDIKEISNSYLNQNIVFKRDKVQFVRQREEASEQFYTVIADYKDLEKKLITKTTELKDKLKAEADNANSFAKEADNLKKQLDTKIHHNEKILEQLKHEKDNLEKVKEKNHKLNALKIKQIDHLETEIAEFILKNKFTELEQKGV